MNGKAYSLRAALLGLTLALLAAGSAFAQALNTAKLEGVVRDADTGQPLAGVQVVVEGTRLGNVTNNDGYYFILNVSPGRRGVTFSYTGYQKTTVANQLLLAGQTMTVDCNLSSTVVQLEGIVIEGQNDILIPRDNTASKQRITSEKLTGAPATRLEDLMVLEAGVSLGGEGGKARGLRIRGGRLGEEAMVVDGVTVRNYTADPYRTGTFWVYTQEEGSLSEDTTPLEFSTSAVEEVDIITGGFQAEYGNAQSGIVNIVTKEGGPDLRGNARWTTDEANPRTSDYGYNQLTTSVGGPVPLIPHLNFQLTGELQGVEDISPTHASEGFRGVNQQFVDRLNWAVRNDPVYGDPKWWNDAGYDEPRPAFILSEMVSAREIWAGRMGEDFFSGHPWVSQGVYSPPNPVRIPDNWQDRNLLNGKLTYSPIRGLKFLMSENFSRYQRQWPSESDAYWRQGWVTPDMLGKRMWSTLKGDMIAGPDTFAYVPIGLGRRTRTGQFLAGVNWDFYQSAERSASLQFRFMNMRVQDINSSNIKENWRRDPQFLTFNVHDLPFMVETFPGRDHLNNPEDAAWYYTDGTGVWNRDHTYWTPFGYSTNSQLYYLNYRYLREDQNTFKLDMEFQLDRHNRMKFGWQGTFFQNNQFQVRQQPRILDNEFDYRPRLFAAYIQNRTDLGDFVFDYGLRWDQFQPRDNWGFRNNDQYGERYFPKDQSELSPRFNVAFPVTDKAQMRFSYGVFTQLPSFTFIFSGNNPGGLGYSRTDAFEAGLSYLLSDETVLDFTGFYRDADGNVSSGSFFRDYTQAVTGRWVRGIQGAFTNSDRANVKGFDLTLRKRFSNHYSLNLIYTLQFSRTTGSSYQASTNDGLRPAREDRTHKLSAHLSYMTDEDVFAGTWANKVFKNVRAYLLPSVMSGKPTGVYVPYTAANASLNRMRGRWDYNVDLRLNKEFGLSGRKRISLFAEVYNLTNRKLPQPYPSGYTFQGYRYATGGVEYKWDTAPSDAKYLFVRDFDGDGVLTIDEAARGAIADAFARATDNFRAWGLARQIRSGIEFTF